MRSYVAMITLNCPVTLNCKVSLARFLYIHVPLPYPRNRSGRSAAMRHRNQCAPDGGNLHTSDIWVDSFSYGNPLGAGSNIYMYENRYRKFKVGTSVRNWASYGSAQSRSGRVVFVAGGKVAVRKARRLVRYHFIICGIRAGFAPRHDGGKLSCSYLLSCLFGMQCCFGVLYEVVVYIVYIV